MPNRRKQPKAGGRRLLLVALSVLAVLLWGSVISHAVQGDADKRNTAALLDASEMAGAATAGLTDYPLSAATSQPAATLAALAREATPTASPSATAVQATASPLPSYNTAKATPTPQPTPTATPALLKSGMKGDAVWAAQQALFALGYLEATPDGTYGKATVAAVKQFQKSNHLKADGIAGALTLSALYSEDAIPFVAAPTATPKAKNATTKATVYVWIPKSGKCYHKKEHCSNMKNPTLVTMQEAIDMGYTPCSKCKPGGL